MLQKMQYINDIYSFYMHLTFDLDFSLELESESEAAVPSDLKHSNMLGPCQQLVCEWGKL